MWTLKTIERTYLRFFILLALLLGGTIQFFGVLSYTKMSLILVFASFIVVVLRSVLYGLKLRFSFIWLILSVLIMSISTMLGHQSVYLFILYLLLFIFTPWAVTSFSRVAAENYSSIVIGFFHVIAIVQLPIILCQRLFATELIKLTHENIDVLDIAFGTFFLKEDHSLGCFLLLFLLAILNNIIPVSHRYKWWLALWITVTILLTNSKMSYLFLVLVWVISFVQRLSVRQIIYSFFSLIILGIAFLISYQFESVQENLNKFVTYNQSMTYAEEKAQFDEGIANRATVVKMFFHEPIRWTGSGPFSFFNPIDEIFVGPRSFSQWVWYYYDTGILGLLAGIMCVFYIVFPSNRMAFVMWLMFISYSMVTNSFFSISLIFVVSFLSQLYSYQKKQLTWTSQ